MNGFHIVLQRCVFMCVVLLAAAMTGPSPAYSGMGEVSEGLLADGRNLAQTGDLDGARRLLERAIVADPANALALAWLGVTHNGLGNAQAAEKYFRVAVEVDPDHPRVLYLAALADIDAGARDVARKKLQRLRVICGAECPEAVELARVLGSVD